MTNIPSIEEDDFNYQRFVNSVFVDGAEDLLCLSNNDSDEEEYQPDEDEEEDEEVDRSLLKVKNEELQGLVQECWQTIANDKPNQLIIPNDQRETIPYIITHESSFHHGNSPTNSQASKENTGQTILSNLIGQVFSGEKPSEVCFEGMPVAALRRLVARQLSMSTQILLQILLQADQNAQCFSDAYIKLMELGNLRESAVSKAALLQSNLKNVVAIQSRLMNHGEGSKHHKPVDEDSLVQRPLTRSRALRPASTSALGSSSGSLLDIPILSNIPSLLQQLDCSRGLIGQQLGSSVLNNPSGGIPPPTDRAHWLSLTSLETSRILQCNRQRQWKCLMPSISHLMQAEGLSGQLLGLLQGTTGANSLAGRSVFSPSEDDLLLRGVVAAHLARKKAEQESNLGSSAETTDWNVVHRRYLPSKTPQLLRFRYSQMLNSTAAEGKGNERDPPVGENKFINFERLRGEQRRWDTKWQPREDRALLQGFQIYGERWRLISMIFLPHRRQEDIKQRWLFWKKRVNRTFPEPLINMFAPLAPLRPAPPHTVPLVPDIYPLLSAVAGIKLSDEPQNHSGIPSGNPFIPYDPNPYALPSIAQTQRGDGSARNGLTQNQEQCEYGGDSGSNSFNTGMHWEDQPAPDFYFSNHGDLGDLPTELNNNNTSSFQLRSPQYNSKAPVVEADLNSRPSFDLLNDSISNLVRDAHPHDSQLFGGSLDFKGDSNLGDRDSKDADVSSKPGKEVEEGEKEESKDKTRVRKRVLCTPVSAELSVIASPFKRNRVEGPSPEERLSRLNRTGKRKPPSSGDIPAVKNRKSDSGREEKQKKPLFEMNPPMNILKPVENMKKQKITSLLCQSINSIKEVKTRDKNEIKGDNNNSISSVSVPVDSSSTVEFNPCSNLSLLCATVDLDSSLAGSDINSTEHNIYTNDDNKINGKQKRPTLQHFNGSMAERLPERIVPKGSHKISGSRGKNGTQSGTKNKIYNPLNTRSTEKYFDTPTKEKKLKNTKSNKKKVIESKEDNKIEEIINPENVVDEKYVNYSEEQLVDSYFSGDNSKSFSFSRFLAGTESLLGNMEIPDLHVSMSAMNEQEPEKNQKNHEIENKIEKSEAQSTLPTLQTEPLSLEQKKDQQPWIDESQQHSLFFNDLRPFRHFPGEHHDQQYHEELSMLHHNTDEEKEGLLPSHEFTMMLSTMRRDATQSHQSPEAPTDVPTEVDQEKDMNERTGTTGVAEDCSSKKDVGEWSMMLGDGASIWNTKETVSSTTVTNTTDERNIETNRKGSEMKLERVEVSGGSPKEKGEVGVGEGELSELGESQGTGGLFATVMASSLLRSAAVRHTQ